MRVIAPLNWRKGCRGRRAPRNVGTPIRELWCRGCRTWNQGHHSPRGDEEFAQQGDRSKKIGGSSFDHATGGNRGNADPSNYGETVENNPTLMRARELEILAKIAENSKLNVVLGEKGLADCVVAYSEV